MSEEYKTEPVIIFDLGNVLVNVDLDALHKECVASGLSNSNGTRNSQDFEALCFRKCIDGLCNFGIMDVLSAIDVVYGFKEDDYSNKKIALRKAWCSDKCVTPNKEIIDYCWELLNRKPKVNLMLASNLGKDHHDYIKSFHLIFRHKRISKALSYQIGSVKPQYVFFKALKEQICELDVLPGKHKSILFIDDRRENLEAGAEYLKHGEWDYNDFQYNSNTDKQSVLIETIESFLNSCK